MGRYVREARGQPLGWGARVMCDAARTGGVFSCGDSSDVNTEAERRFGDNWFGELRVRAFSGAEQGDTTYWLQKDDYVQLSLSRYF